MEKVLILSDYADSGGTGVYIKYLLKYLTQNYNVHIVLHDNKRNSTLLHWFSQHDIAYSFDYIIHPRIEHFVFRAFRKVRVDMFYLFVRDTLNRIRLEHKYKPDLLCISQGGGLNYFPFLLSRRPVFFIIHSLFTSSLRTMFFGTLYAKLYKQLKTSNKLICSVSSYASDLFLKNCTIPKFSECSICIPSYGAEFSISDRPERYLIKVLTLGHVIGYKNPGTWLDVAIAVVKKYPGRVSFTWVGCGELYQEMIDRTADLENIHFIGFREETEPLYRDADIYFQPSIWESQGISVVEALSNSLPCVVSDAGGLPESVEDGKEGYVCNVFDTMQYVEAFSNLIDNKELRMELSKNARAKYNNKFTEKIWVDKMDEAFSRLC